jgi:hypothetical protein
MTTKRLTTPLAALTLVGVLAACSGSNDSDDVASVTDDGQSSESAEGDEAELLDWVECMRGEGIDIADPTRDSDGNLVLGGDSGDQDDGKQGSAIDVVEEGSVTPEDMEAAEEACGSPPALGAGNISEEDQQAMQDAALEFAKCMRDEGIDDFPDPDFSDTGPGGEAQRPSPGDSEAGDGPDQQVVTGPFGDIVMDDPETKAAFEACQDVLGVPGGPQDAEG